MRKYIFVTGGVVSGLGKGIAAASLGLLLKQSGLKVAAQKLDPYINVDPGTMSPLQHGEVFVTEDGAETDLDLGHYERFIDENLHKYSNLTSGKVYYNVISREREGGYLGQTVQVVPHITNEIKEFIYKSGEKSNCDVLITEIGGTVGDIESQPFLEAIRQISLEQGLNNCLFMHVVLVPYLASSEEHKSKPAQHSVKELRGIGIAPNIIVARTDVKMAAGVKDKIALFCNVREECVVENVTLGNLYEVPIMIQESKLQEVVCRELNLEYKEPDMNDWNNVITKMKSREKTANIALVGKYTELHDAYLSVIESLNHAGIHSGADVKIKWVDSEILTDKNIDSYLSSVDGIIVPGGFGDRGIDGMVLACKYARENNVPYLGLCLGMQISIIEFARNVCNFKDANSSEFSSTTEHPVIHIMESQKNIDKKGGTMRLGSYNCKIKENTLLEKLYQSSFITERHRHRYEVNNEYRELFTEKGLTIAGTSPDNNLVEAVEIKDHKFFCAVQFHPEFKSRPTKAHPLFLGFIKASIA